MMNKLQRYTMDESDYIGASMEKDDYGDWCDAEDVAREFDLVRSQVIKVAGELVLGRMLSNLRAKCETQNTIATGVLRGYLEQIESVHRRMAIELRDAVIKQESE